MDGVQWHVLDNQSWCLKVQFVYLHAWMVCNMCLACARKLPSYLTLSLFQHILEEAKSIQKRPNPFSGMQMALSQRKQQELSKWEPSRGQIHLEEAKPISDMQMALSPKQQEDAKRACTCLHLQCHCRHLAQLLSSLPSWNKSLPSWHTCTQGPWMNTPCLA